MFFQTLVTGLSIGGIYALMAVGYSLIFSIMGFSNFAYGSIIMLASYFAYFAISSYGFSFPMALLISMLAAAVLSVFTERVAYNPLRKRRAPSLFLMISAMGCSMFLEHMVYVTIGGSYHSFPTVFAIGAIDFFGVSLSFLDIFAILFSFSAIALLNYFINRTRLGIAIRAVSYDSVTAQVNGVNLGLIIGFVFVLSGVLASISGVFLGMKYMVYPAMGIITNKAYISAVIGGLGSLPGAVIGGVILGVLESLVSVYLSSSFRDVFSFTFLIAMLVILPTGILGKRHVEKV